MKYSCDFQRFLLKVIKEVFSLSKKIGDKIIILKLFEKI